MAIHGISLLLSRQSAELSWRLDCSNDVLSRGFPLSRHERAKSVYTRGRERFFEGSKNWGCFVCCIPCLRCQGLCSAGSAHSASSFGGARSARNAPRHARFSPDFHCCRGARPWKLDGGPENESAIAGSTGRHRTGVDVGSRMLNEKRGFAFLKHSISAQPCPIPASREGASHVAAGRKVFRGRAVPAPCISEVEVASDAISRGVALGKGVGLCHCVRIRFAQCRAIVEVVGNASGS